MQLPATFEDLVTEAIQMDLYDKLVRQLNKDLALSNIDLEFQPDVIPTSLRYLMHEAIYNLIQNKFTDYLNLLYIVDVPEYKVKELDGSDLVRLSEAVTLLILQREWKKVWYRSQYS